jgi:molybdopterin molybdotransferase
MSHTPTRELDGEAALASLCKELVPIADRESVPLDAAVGRVLAQDLISELDLPAFANSAMDGYAVRAADCPAASRLRVVGTAFAGHPYRGALTPGVAVRIMTGAPMPDGADAVVAQEEVTRQDDWISFSTLVRPGLNVRERGKHVRKGTVVVGRRTTLHAAEIGLATALGLTRVEVFRRLRVGIASTGDELADPPSPLVAAASYDANRPLLAIAVRAAGFTAVDLGICRDQAAEFVELLDRACAQELDVLLVSGGSAQGDADVVRKADAVRFLPTNIRPGRGITFGRFASGQSRLALFGLPGNAVAGFIMFHLVALPAMRHLAGGLPRVPTHLPVALAVDLACEAGRVDYRRGCFEYDAGGRIAVRPLEQQGSAMLRTIVDADVLIAAGPLPLYRADEPILVVPLAGLPR